MRSDVQIRRATRSDEDFVLATTARLVAFGPPPWRTAAELVEGERRTLRAFFITPPRDAELLIAERSRPLGFVYLETLIDYFTRERHGHVGIIAVSEEGEGQGVGFALMSAAEAWAHGRGFRRLTLNVFEGNLRARRLYERSGFKAETLRYVRTLDRAATCEPQVRAGRFAVE